MIKTLIAKNFLSWKTLKFEFDSGVTLLGGFNYDDNTEEAVGKSAIPNAICWCLFGVLPKDVKINEVITEGEKNCLIVLTLDSGTQICRSRNPHDLYIVENNKVIRGSSQTETQKIIEKLLSLTFETFCASIYFPQNYDNSFLTINEAKKTSLLSKILDFDNYDATISKIKEKMKIISKEGDKLNQNILLLREKFKNLVAQKNTTINYHTSQLEEKSKKLESLHKELKNLQIPIETKLDLKKVTLELENFQKSLSFNQEKYINLESERKNNIQLKKNIKLIEDSIKEVKNSSNKLISQINFLQENTEICPTCKQICNKELHNSLISAKKEEVLALEQKNSELTKLLQEATAAVKNEDPNLESELKKRIKESTFGINKIENSIKEHDLLQIKLKTNKDSIIKQIKELEFSINAYKVLSSKDISKLTEDLLNLEKSIKEETGLSKVKTEENKELDLIIDSLKGAKSYLYKEALSFINHQTNKYLQDLFEIPISLDFHNINEAEEQTKIEVTLQIEGKERSLFLLSGGQLKRVKLAVDLSLSDLILQRNHNIVNLLIFDEYFTNLSSESKEKVLNLFNKINKTILLIEHDDILKNLATKRITIKYQNGESSFE